MPTSFLTGLSTEVKPYITGLLQDEGVTRYLLTNSRNRNRKIYKKGAAIASQNAGIDAPTAAPTGVGGTGANFYYVYVYVNKFFNDPLALEFDPYIRGNSSPVSAAIASGTTPATITGTASTDAQVTHAWLYMSTSAAGPFYRAATGYEVVNAGPLTWTSPITVATTNYVVEIDNFVPDTARICEEANGFVLYGGFVPITANASVTIGSPTVTVTAPNTFPDGIIGLNLQFNADATGGPSNNGVHLAVWATSGTVTLVNVDGTPRNYDGASDQTNATVRIWRNGSIIQISKRYNPDAIPGIVDPDFIIQGNGTLTAIAKPQTGFAMRFHYNNNGRKSVEIVDFTEGIPARRYQSSSVYAAGNPRAWCSAGGRMFYYDPDAGIIEDKGAQHVPLSIGVIPNLIRSLGANSADLSEMEYDESRNLMFLSVCPAGYTRCYYLIVYNLTTSTFNLWFMLPDVNTMKRIKNSANQIVVKMGSSQGSYMSWPSVNYNEGVGSSPISGVVLTATATTITTYPSTFPSLVDRWVMVWDDSLDNPTYMFGRIASNDDATLTIDTVIGGASTTEFNPIPASGSAFWVGPIQAILGPNWEYNSTPDDDGQTFDISMTTSGLNEGQNSRLSLYRNFETTPVMGQSMIHNTYSDGSIDPDHQSLKLGASSDSVETTGVTGWAVTDNNEAALSIKAIVRRVRAVSDKKQSKDA